MASPGFEVGRPSPVATEVARMLERCLKESRAVDTESLCIIAGEKVRFEVGLLGRPHSCCVLRSGPYVWTSMCWTTVETSLMGQLLPPLLLSNTSGRLCDWMVCRDVMMMSLYHTGGQM